ncbi:MAG: glutamate synthase [Pseudomonadales bacterium]|nr:MULTISPECIES: CDGSH iron-sulfur domain-containing protein [unclassified Ketobacter]MAA59933.1 glutamate synthase [Pseudomonadales bacterium]MEC8811355.1 CDGSH iron-sulfur domain-containing protein [Pseudomonadota bacterium]TNC86875.1 MAG: glutamate synthase [Alcanivorax sp.]HAG95168.1 glutamate synthase [Gammaproteobacteria bacterium]MAQ23937.1 glutamate synthase [Pseudomonadales bacterium]
MACALPLPTRIRRGQHYWWCSCGLSQQQPFCDGSHQGTGFQPVKITAEKNEIYFFCGCKRSTQGPLCDGRSHQSATED